jgi:hypothetical protein
MNLTLHLVQGKHVRENEAHYPNSNHSSSHVRFARINIWIHGFTGDYAIAGIDGVIDWEKERNPETDWRSYLFNPF